MCCVFFSQHIFSVYNTIFFEKKLCCEMKKINGGRWEPPYTKSPKIAKFLRLYDHVVFP